MTLLPVSGITLSVREPTGEDELYVVETAFPPFPAMLGLARRVARTAAGQPLDWAILPAADLGAAVLIIRQSWIGDVIRSDIWCPEPGCGDRIDITFSIGEYLRHHRPRRPRGVTAEPSGGWYSLSGTPGARGRAGAGGAAVRFRIPTVDDLIAASGCDQPTEELTGRCVDAPDLAWSLAQRLDRALSALAPSLDDLLGGECPGCGQTMTMRFEPLGYALAELQNAFSGIYAETHALARSYGWPEGAILALPRNRRRRYVSVITDERLTG